MKLIAIVDGNWAIGKQDHLLFNIPEDMIRFTELTRGHSIVVGRRTSNTFRNGKLLDDRINYIISRTEEVSGAIMLRTMQEATDKVPDDAWVIGGASIYEQLIQYCDEAYITEVRNTVPGADSFLPRIDHDPEWSLTEEGEWKIYGPFIYRFLKFNRTSKYNGV